VQNIRPPRTQQHHHLLRLTPQLTKSDTKKMSRILTFINTALHGGSQAFRVVVFVYSTRWYCVLIRIWFHCRKPGDFRTNIDW